MNTRREEPEPLVNIERNPLVPIISLALSTALVYLVYYSIFSKEVTEIKPLGFFLFVPAVLSVFQSLWFLLNPFIVIYEDKMELKKWMFSNKEWQFVDIKACSLAKGNKLQLVYNDNDVDSMQLSGIRSSHKDLLLKSVQQQVDKSLNRRAQL